MEIRIRATGEVMFEDAFRDYQKANGGPSWDRTTDEVLEALGADPVFEGPQATPTNPYQFSIRQGVEQVGGKWYTKYVLGPIFIDTPEATAAQHEAEYKAQKDADQARLVRHARTEKLNASDWTQVADAPVDKAVWATYRQALRDISTQAGFPWEVTWPTEP